MKMTALRMGLIALGLLGPAAVSTVSGASSSAASENTQGHASGLMAKITTRDGNARTVKLEGVGCAKAICSRTAIKGQGADNLEVSAWLDSLAAIRETSGHDALFVSKDGTSRRLSLLTDFRVLYLANRLGGAQKLDLAQVESVEFVGSGK